MPLYTMPCVIFAGGKSSRMGEDKAFLPFGNYESLIEYQVQRLKKIFTNVYVSAKDKEKFKALNVMVIEDVLHNEIYAPTAGFVNIFKTLKNDNSFFVLSVDTPFVNEELISKFIEASKDDYDAIIGRTSFSIHPLCGIYTRALEEPIQTMVQEDNHKLMRLLENAKVHYIDIKEEESLLNLNTPHEYQQALKLLKNNS